MKPSRILLIDDNKANVQRASAAFKQLLPTVEIAWLRVIGSSFGPITIPGVESAVAASDDEAAAWLQERTDLFRDNILIFWDIQLLGVVETIQASLMSKTWSVVASHLRPSGVMVAVHSGDFNAATFAYKVAHPAVVFVDTLTTARDPLKWAESVLHAWRRRHPDGIEDAIFGYDHGQVGSWFTNDGLIKHNWSECYSSGAWCSDATRDAFMAFVVDVLGLADPLRERDRNIGFGVHDGLKHLLGAHARAYHSDGQRPLNTNAIAVLLCGKLKQLGYTEATSRVTFSRIEGCWLLSRSQTTAEIRRVIGVLCDDVLTGLLVHKDDRTCTLVQATASATSFTIELKMDSIRMLEKMRAFPAAQAGSVYGNLCEFVRVASVAGEARDARCVVNARANEGNLVLEWLACR
jgi:hypothetical protein